MINITLYYCIYKYKSISLKKIFLIRKISLIIVQNCYKLLKKHYNFINNSLKKDNIY